MLTRPDLGAESHHDGCVRWQDMFMSGLCMMMPEMLGEILAIPNQIAMSGSLPPTFDFGSFLETAAHSAVHADDAAHVAAGSGTVVAAQARAETGKPQNWFPTISDTITV